MALFLILAVLTTAGLVLRQSALRFRATRPAAGSPHPGASFKLADYLRWLTARMKSVFSPAFPVKVWNVFNGWAGAHFPGLLKWIFLVFVAAFFYLAGSGFFFALFFRRGMFGLPLLAHVMSGGLFALGLAVILLWRARAYRPDQAEAAVFESFACPVFKNLSKAFARIAVFWAFAAFGFVQVTTALCSMLPVFTYETQNAIIMIHRYSGLGLVLTGILLLDLALLEPVKTPPT